MFGFSKKERVEKAVRNATKLSERLAKLRDPRNGFAPAADVLAAEVHLRAIVAQIQSKSKGLKLSESATLQLQALTQVVNQGKVGTPSGPYRRSNGNGTEARVDNVWNLEKPKLFASMTSNPLYVPHSSPRLQRGFDPLSSPGFNQSKSQASATHSDAAAPADSLEKSERSCSHVCARVDQSKPCCCLFYGVRNTFTPHD
jgi:hypothetical protein